MTCEIILSSIPVHPLSEVAVWAFQSARMGAVNFLEFMVYLSGVNGWMVGNCVVDVLTMVS